MGIRVGKGRSEVRIDGPIADDIERELRGVLGPVAGILDRRGEALLRETKRTWPRKTGKSADAWDAELRVLPGTWRVEKVLRNPHSYIRYIKSTKINRRQDATRLRAPLSDVRRGARDNRRGLRRELRDAIVEALERGVLS